ncbi:MAG: hypothetical protein NVV82_22450 [Sporocytophaga sp.]|nr:hypothetical protein [Sporocytophaga sp.]
MNQLEKTRREEDFETWVTFIPDQINELKSELPKELANNLDFKISSLDSLEKYLLENYNRENIKTEENKFLLDRIGRYIGTVFTRNIKNAYWDIELDDEKGAFYGLPVIKVKDSSLAPFSPFSMTTALFSRNKGNFLSSIVQNSKRHLEQNI